jgi:O-antigen/teichoic acid export membrane protein
VRASNRAESPPGAAAITAPSRPLREILHNSSWAIAGTAVSAGGLFVETVLLAGQLGVHSYGVFVLAIAYAEGVQTLLDFRTREAMTKFLSEFLALNDRASAAALVKVLWFIDLVVSAVALALVVVSSRYLAGHLLHEPNADYLVQIAAVGTFFGALDATGGTILRVFNRFGVTFTATTATTILRLGLISAGVAMNFSVVGFLWVRVAAEVATTAVMAALTLVVLKKALWRERRASYAVLRSRRHELRQFLLSTNVAGLLRLASSKFDVLIVGFVGTPGVAALYKVAVQFGTSPLLIADPLFIAVYPPFSRWWTLGLRGQIRMVTRRTTVVIACLAIPIAVALALASKPLLDVTVGAEFSAASTPLIILLAATVPSVILFWTRPVMLSMGEAGLSTAFIAVGSALELALLFILVPPFGAVGAAVSVGSMYVVTLLLTTAHLSRRKML